MAKKQFKDTDFMNELEAATSMRPAMPAVLMLFTIVALFTFLIVWAGIAEVEELTRGEGKVVPSQDIQVVQSLEGGVIEEILITEGDLVEEGQIVIRISDIQFSSQERGTEAKFFGLRAKKARLQAEVNGNSLIIASEIENKYPEVAKNEKALYRSRRNELFGAIKVLDDRIDKAEAEMSEVDAQVARLSNNAESLREELAITSDLVRARSVPKLEELRLQRELNDVLGQINAERERRRSLEAEKRGAEGEKRNLSSRYKSDSLTELNEVETEISALQENLKSITDRVERAEIRSPVDGVVNRIAVKTVGGVVEPAQALAEIVPADDDLKIIAEVTPEQIAFLRPGLPAKVKLSAYDPQKYGSLDATLVRIGANSIAKQDGTVVFEVEVRADKNYIGTPESQLPITPGMVATIEVITGKRTILYYLLKPIFRARDRVLTER